MPDSVRPHRRQPTRLPRPWDSPGKNTGVGCHVLLQCMKVKRESEVAQSRPTLSGPWTAAHQAPPSVGFARQEYWSGTLLLLRGDITYVFSNQSIRLTPQNSCNSIISLVAQMVKNPPTMWETWVQSLEREDHFFLERGHGFPTPVFLPGEFHR